MKNVMPNLCVDDSRGFMTVFDELPFDCKRFFTISASKGQTRGRHSHKKTRMILYVLTGCVELEVSTQNSINIEVLKPGSHALLLEPTDYRVMNFIQDSTLLVLASTVFDRTDYVFEVPS
jgi:hypothetical protein